MIKLFKTVKQDRAVDAEYLAWLSANPNGYVLNCSHKPPQRDYPVLHHAGCWTIGPEGRGHSTGPQLYKACSTNKQELVEWATAQQDAAQTVCRWCAARTGLALAAPPPQQRAPAPTRM